MDINVDDTVRVSCARRYIDVLFATPITKRQYRIHRISVDSHMHCATYYRTGSDIKFILIDLHSIATLSHSVSR